MLQVINHDQKRNHKGSKVQNKKTKYFLIVGLSVAIIYLAFRKIKKSEEPDIYANLVGKNNPNERIVCQNCGWSWKVKDGGDDLYMCHRCGCNNTPLA
jgi:hypothetical protein